MEKRGKERLNRLGSNGSQTNRSDLRNSSNVVGSHEFKVLGFSYDVRDTSIYRTDPKAKMEATTTELIKGHQK